MVRVLSPGNRSAALPWIIWTLWQQATTAVSSTTSGHYPGGVVPSTGWTADGSGSPTLAQCIQNAGDGLNAKLVAGGALSSTRWLLTGFGGMPQAAGSTVRYVRFKIARRRESGVIAFPGVLDLSVCITKNGAPLTSVNKALPDGWPGSDTEASAVYYTFDSTELATLGVTVSDLVNGVVGVGIQVSTSSSTTIYVDQVTMDVAYSPVVEPQVHYCQLPGNITLPSPWLRIFTWTPAVPSTDTVMGIEVDITAWTDDPSAAAADPVTKQFFDGTVVETPIGGTTTGTGTQGVVRDLDSQQLLQLELEPIPSEPSEPGGPMNPGGGMETPPFGTYYYPLEVALSLDGVNPVGDTWVIFPTLTANMFTCGTPTYLWNRGATWLPGDFAGTFSVLIRRPQTATAVSSQYVTTARVRLTTTSTEGSLTMSIRQELTEIVLLGAETVAPGTLSIAFRRMRALNYRSRPNVNMKKFRPQGEKMNAVVVPTREWATGSISGLLDYNEFPIPLEAIIGKGVHSGGTVNQRNVHTYLLENRKRTVYQTYSLQRGEKTTRAHQHRYLVHSGLQLQINTTDCQVSGAFFAQSIEDGITMATGANEVQAITVTGSPTGGTYRLAFRGAETTDLAFGANAAAIQTALQALSTVGAGNATVTGTGPFVVTFASALAAEAQPLIVLVRNNLTGGTTPTVTISETTRGGWAEYQLVPVLPQHWNIYLADTQAGLNAGKLDKSVGVAAAGIDVADRHNPFFVLDRDVAGTFPNTTEMDPKFVANLTVGANSTGMALLNTLRTGATKWLRLEAVGPLIGGTSDPHKMIWEGPVKVADTGDFGNEDGRVVYPWALEWTEGPNGEVPTLVIENGVVSY